MRVMPRDDSDLRDRVGDKAVIGVAISAFGSPGEDHFWVKLIE